MKPQTNLKRLDALARTVGPWQSLSLAAGVFQTAAIVLQAFSLSVLLCAIVFPQSGADPGWAWIALPVSVVLRAIFSVIREDAGNRSSAAVRSRLRALVLEKIHDQGPAWKTRFSGGSLSTTIVERIDSLDAYFSKHLTQKKLVSIAPTAILALVLSMNWLAAVIFFVTAPLIPFFMAIIGMGAQAEQKKQHSALSNMSGRFFDLIRGMASLKLLGVHREQRASVEAQAQTFRRRTMKVLYLAFLSSSVLEFFTALSIALTALYLGFTLLGDMHFAASWGTEPKIGQAFLILLLAPEFYWPLRELALSYHAGTEAEAAASVLFPLLDEESVQVTSSGPSVPGGPVSIDFKAVDFRYVDDVPVLKALSFSIPAGSTCAVVGPSGSGKTTLLRLILGQLRPKSGTVLISGLPMGQLDLDELRLRTGLMNQHPRLLSATLAENLRCSKTGATEEQMAEALEFAGLDRWAQNLPEGWNTSLGEAGRSLSGGQLRRLALARLFLRGADLLLLDEPTASLDDEAEAFIVERLEKLKKGKTVALLTHREGPLKLADSILNLSEGAS